ncbi:hypothetical protein [Streptomyces lacrimifluminis]|nr:hypothetical protein [Streptomyces lacrimifluminis]
MHTPRPARTPHRNGPSSAPVTIRGASGVPAYLDNDVNASRAAEPSLEP